MAWEEFDALYAPLLYRYARARGLNHADADEIKSSCYETLATSIQDFQYAKDKGGFKAWLRRMVRNRVIDLKRKRDYAQLEDDELGQIADTDATPDQAFEEQWKISHLRFCLDRVKNSLPDKTYQAFELLANENSVETVCERVGLNRNQVYKAKSQVLRLVREEMRMVYGEEMS